METYFQVLCIFIMILLCFVFKALWNKSRGLSNLQMFTQSDLRKYNGIRDQKVYIAVNNLIFDVTKSNNYGPNCTYSMFAGHDCTVSLGKMSFETEYLDSDYSLMNQEQKATMMQWYDKFMNNYKYPVVGKIRHSDLKDKEDY